MRGRKGRRRTAAGAIVGAAATLVPLAATAQQPAFTTTVEPAFSTTVERAADAPATSTPSATAPARNRGRPRNAAAPASTAPPEQPAAPAAAPANAAAPGNASPANAALPDPARLGAPGGVPMAPAMPAVKINPTGKTISIEVPLKMDKGYVGDIPIRITADDQVFVEAEGFATILKRIVKPEVVAAVTGKQVAPGDVPKGPDSSTRPSLIASLGNLFGGGSAGTPAAPPAAAAPSAASSAPAAATPPAAAPGPPPAAVANTSSHGKSAPGASAAEPAVPAAAPAAPVPAAEPPAPAAPAPPAISPDTPMAAAPARAKRQAGTDLPGRASLGGQQAQLVPIQPAAPPYAPPGAPGTVHVVELPGYVSIAVLRHRGLEIVYDPLASELVVVPNVGQRIEGTISVWSPGASVISANAAKPAMFSGFLNMRAAFDYVEQSHTGQTGAESPRFDLEGAIRVGNVVLEAEYTFDSGERWGFYGNYFTNYGFQRRGARLVYDLPEYVLRIRAGDIYPGFAAFQGAPDLLGVQVERSYSKLRPTANIRPTGHSTFRIDRRSHVDILVDNVIIRRVSLPPGDYNVRDLPLKPGANNVTLVITDDTGETRRLDFSVFSARTLLAPGVDEFSFAGGVRARRVNGEPDYDWADAVATGFYRIGLTHDFTGEVHAQGDEKVVMGGAGGVWQSPIGLVSSDLAVSHHAVHGAGFAVSGSYDVLNKLGWDGFRHSFRLAAEYRSDNFATVNSHEPRNDYWLAFTALYSRELPWEVTAALSGRYQMSRDHALYDDRWSVDLSLSKRLLADISGSLTVGYGEGGRRFHAADAFCATCTLSDDNGFHVFARVHWRIDDKSSLSFAHDTRNDVSNTTYVRNGGSGIGSWNAVVNAATDHRTDEATLSGGVGYVANRFEASVSHASRLTGIGYGAYSPYSSEQRTSARIETGIAFASTPGGVAFAWGRPVRGGFAIVEGHENLDGRKISLGAREAEVARSDGLGPALVPDVFAYSMRRVEYDVPDLPLGYDLGAGAFDFFAPYRAGYHVKVGSDYTVSALGTLIGRDGQPIALIAGMAFEGGSRDGVKVPLFTNRAGRFGAQGLAPGKWVIEMATEPATSFVLIVPPKTVGLLNAGVLHPAR